AAEGELDDGAAPRQLPGIGVAKLRAIAEEERMAMVDELADELLLVVHRDLEGRGLAAESPVEREPAGELARLLVLHALLAPLQEVVAPAPARARRRVEVEPALPVQVVEADLAPQPPRALEDVEVGVAPLDARADVGVEAEPGLDLLRASLDHRDAHRRRLGAVAVG